MDAARTFLQATRGRCRNHARRAAAVALLLALAACSPGADIDIAHDRSAAPGTIDFPIAYVKKTLPPRTDDLRELRDAVPDADIYVRDRAEASAPERNITERVTKTDRYDIKDLNVSFDGTRLIFAMRGPLAANQNEKDPPSWNIWEYVFATDDLRRVIPSDIVAEEGNDVGPHYLPDGRIVFSSTRQRASKAILLDENKPQFEALTEARNEPAFNLHVMDANGGNIHQITFGQGHDRDATVLRDGRVMWSRWESGTGGGGIHLYAANPDGTDVQLLYGAHSHQGSAANERLQFVQAREMPAGGVLALVRPFTDADFGGDLDTIDTRTYVENTQPTLQSPNLAGPAQVPVTGNRVSVGSGISEGGRFGSAFPLWDGSNRILLSWTPCRAQIAGQLRACTPDVLADPSVQPAAALYSLWMYDVAQHAFLPLMTPEPGVMITEGVVGQPRPLPAVILDKAAPLDLNGDFVAEGVGVVDIRSVYDVDGVDTARPSIAGVADPRVTTAAQRPARFVRIEKAVSIPDNDVLNLDNSAFGASNFMREILGYAPVEPDGSVKVKVPANVAFQITVLDASGQRISPRHVNWLQLRPGETLSCNGCHDPASGKSHGRAGLFNAVNAGAAAGGVPFRNTLPSFTPQTGETMAEARARVSCAANSCRDLAPSVDVVFDDVWTDPAAAGRPKDASFAYRYVSTDPSAPGLATVPPTTLDCATRWSARCRITINYTQHIHPLWKVPRLTLDANGNVTADHTCVACHSPKDAQNAVRVPAGQLDLSDGASDEVATQFKSYRELLFTDNAQEVNMGALRDILVPGVDPVTGQPTLVPVPVPPSMVAGSARVSTRFFSRFVPGGSHAGYLTAAELRLLSEWLDIGAQYFNNPFDPSAPLN
ncbi:MAG: hypothetical protein WCE48_10785 [Steroidobacteraceae bacterium]